MSGLRQWMTVSAVLHAALAGAGAQLFSWHEAQPPLAMDFTIEKLPPAPPQAPALAHRQPVPPPVPAQQVFPDTAAPDTADTSLALVDTAAAPAPPAQCVVASTGSADSLRQLLTAYLRYNYGAIRDRVYSRLTYPQLALEQGLQGRLEVSFWVHCEGRVDNIRVLRSSGHRLLDQSAMAAVQAGAPYPRSPRKVEVRLPIEFRLE